MATRCAPSISDLKRALAKMHGLSVERTGQGRLRIVGRVPDGLYALSLPDGLTWMVEIAFGRIARHRPPLWWELEDRAVWASGPLPSNLGDLL